MVLVCEIFFEEFFKMFENFEFFVEILVYGVFVIYYFKCLLL